ncbi:MAG: right-handed parallel beta-helix repeat-containing protein [Promethearchaeati archaeon]
MRTRFAFLCIFGVLLLVALATDHANTVADSTDAADGKSALPSYTKHDPILITSNADFPSDGWPGNGSVDNPYIIDGLSITNNSTCINITDTTVYFEIRNCKISSDDSTWKPGIYFENVTYGSITSSSVDSHSGGIRLRHSSHCLIRNNTAIGFSVSNSSSCTITNSLATGNSANGFSLHESSNCSITSNTATGGFDDALTLINSANCTVKDNNFMAGGLFISGSGVSHWLHDFSDNTINGKPLGYFKNVIGSYIDCSQYGQVLLVNSSHVTIMDGVFVDVGIGIQVVYSTNCTLENNTASGSSWYGFHVLNSPNCTLKHNTASYSTNGFEIVDSSFCLLTNNTAIGNDYPGFYIYGSFCSSLKNNFASSNLWGFYVVYSNNSTLSNNAATTNWDGFQIRSSHCMLVNNLVTNNSHYGIFLNSDTSNNLLYLNRIGDNDEANAYDSGDSNRWDNGTHGNYWGDYDGSGTYSVRGPHGSTGSIDHHPFVLGASTTDVTPSPNWIYLSTVILVISAVALVVVLARWNYIKNR